MGNPDEPNAEVEIKAAICEIENGNFKSAQTTLESVLKKDAKNIYALRLLPGIAARQIKKDDNSPENTALVRKAIEAYESAALNPLFKNERAEINQYIISLYGRLGSEEKAALLLKKAENESEEAKQRAAFYTSIAADNYACANEISDVSPVKSIVKKNGKDVYVFRKPQNPADFRKLKTCAAKGSELIRKATALDPASDTAWSYQASLSSQLARIAEMEGKPDEKARQLKEYDAARAKFMELSRKRSDELAKKDAEPLGKTLSDGVKFSSADISEAELKEFREELKSYRFERPLAETVDSVYIPFELVAPIAPGDDPPTPPNDAATKPSEADDEKQNREWKIFSQEGGLSAELPGNVDVSSTSDSRIYTASGGGLSFFILETNRSLELSANEQDAALNMMAWILTKFFAGKYVGNGRWNERFESELARKDKLNDRPARFYAYRTISCKEKKEGTMIFVISKKNYAINIHGAGESDERVRRFLKSLKLV